MLNKDAADDDDAEKGQEIDLRDQFDDPPPIPTQVKKVSEWFS